MARLAVLLAALVLAACEAEGTDAGDAGGTDAAVLGQAGDPCDGDFECASNLNCSCYEGPGRLCGGECRAYGCGDNGDGFGRVCHPWPCNNEPDCSEPLACETAADCHR